MTTLSQIVLIRPPDISREGLKFYPWTFFFYFFFYQSTVLSSRMVDGHQMYFGVLVVGKASTVGTEISPTPPQFSQGSKSVIFGVIFNITHLWAEQNIWILKQKCNAAVIALCLCQVLRSWVHIPEKALPVVSHPHSHGLFDFTQFCTEFKRITPEIR